MVSRFALTLALFALTLPATAAARENRIVGGTESNAAELPYAAGLEIALQNVGDDAPDALCGGSLIAARWVVTAAHCLAEQPIDPANSYVILGATNLDAATADQVYAIADFGFLKQYATGNGGYDVGVIKLARPAPNQQIRLARPFADQKLVAGGVPALTAGWGLTEDKEDGGALSTAQLRKVDLTLYSDTDCTSAFSAAGQNGGLDFSTEICALAPNKDSCNGDSGGPLIVADTGGRPTLIGAVSFGIGGGDPVRAPRSCNEGPPGVYAKIATNPLNGLIRDLVPQVEIDPDVLVPVPGEKVTLTADPKAPGGSGSFGGYDTLAWDLNGDGTFAEEVGKRRAGVVAVDGITTVSVQATTAAGDAETRTVSLVSQNKSAVAFAKAAAKVRRGRSVRLKINRIGVGAGTVRVKVSGHGVTPRSKTIKVKGTEPSVTIKLRAKRSASSKVTVRLASFRGAVIAGTRTKLTLRTKR